MFLSLIFGLNTLLIVYYGSAEHTKWGILAVLITGQLAGVIAYSADLIVDAIKQASADDRARFR